MAHEVVKCVQDSRRRFVLGMNSAGSPSCADAHFLPKTKSRISVEEITLRGKRQVVEELLCRNVWLQIHVGFVVRVLVGGEHVADRSLDVALRSS